MDLNKEFEELKEYLVSEKFLQGVGVGNDLNLHIYAYNPKDEIEIRWRVNQLEKYLKDKKSLNIKSFDLYDMFIEILENDDLIDKVIEMETEEGKEETLHDVTTFVDTEMYIDKIKPELSHVDLVFITGIGKVYPFMRAHNILNNLHSIIGKIPLVMFYPGKYTGQDFTLFGEIDDDNYYRAFPLVLG